MSRASSRLPTILRDTLKSTRWYRSTSCPNAPPSPSRHRSSSRPSSSSSALITGDSLESWRGALLPPPVPRASAPCPGSVKPQHLVEPRIDEYRPDPGLQVGEPETVAGISESLVGLDEHTESRARDIVQIREVDRGRFIDRLERGLGAGGLRGIEPSGELDQAAALELDLEHQRGNFFVRVMMALRSLYSYRMESEIRRTRRSPKPPSPACERGAVGSKGSTSKSRSVTISSSCSPVRLILTSGPPPFPCLSMFVKSSSMRR